MAPPVGGPGVRGFELELNVGVFKYGKTLKESTSYHTEKLNMPEKRFF